MGLSINEDVIGFGEPSKRGRTVNGNYFIRVTTTPCVGGADVLIETRHGLMFDDGTTERVERIRKDLGPRIGERSMVCGMLVKVADKRYDDSGSLWVMDEDTRAWLPWEARE